jgi:hypothetical protein
MEGDRWRRTAEEFDVGYSSDGIGRRSKSHSSSFLRRISLSCTQGYIVLSFPGVAFWSVYLGKRRWSVWGFSQNLNVWHNEDGMKYAIYRRYHYEYHYEYEKEYKYEYEYEHEHHLPIRPWNMVQ